MSFAVEPLDAPLGAVLSGVDGRKPLSDQGFHCIERALLEHLVVVIPDLEGDIDWLLEFGRRFGPLAEHILTRFHHPKTPEMSIISANMNQATLHCAMADYREPMRKLRMIVGCTERASPGAGNLLN